MSIQKKPHRCEICGCLLYRGYYYTSRCSKHQTTKDADVKLTGDAVAAKEHGLSYGQYMAAVREGRA